MEYNDDNKNPRNRRRFQTHRTSNEDISDFQEALLQRVERAGKFTTINLPKAESKNLHSSLGGLQMKLGGVIGETRRLKRGKTRCLCTISGIEKMRTVACWYVIRKAALVTG